MENCCTKQCKNATMSTAERHADKCFGVTKDTAAVSGTHSRFHGSNFKYQLFCSSSWAHRNTNGHSTSHNRTYNCTLLKQHVGRTLWASTPKRWPPTSKSCSFSCVLILLSGNSQNSLLTTSSVSLARLLHSQTPLFYGRFAQGSGMCSAVSPEKCKSSDNFHSCANCWKSPCVVNVPLMSTCKRYHKLSRYTNFYERGINHIFFRG